MPLSQSSILTVFFTLIIHAQAQETTISSDSGVFPFGTKVRHAGIIGPHKPGPASFSETQFIAKSRWH